MDIRNSLDGLKTLLGVDVAAPAATQQPRSTTATGGSTLSGDRATFSSAASEASLAIAEPEVRLDKVAAVQAALAAGTYNVPASAVASKVVDSMIGAQQ
jgi:negative regulator of flagellin synthesis FlgM